MVEVQKHGFSFEKWIKDTFFGGYEGSYTQEWDIPPDQNIHNHIPPHLRNHPVSVKTAKYLSPISLGDVIRQRNISVPFVMIAGFWSQRTDNKKWFEEIEAVLFTPDIWEKLWGTLSIERISLIDTQIKNLDLHYSEARKIAKSWKAREIDPSGSTIVINPKIDSKKQRRIQCSLPFNAFWECAGRNAEPSNSVEFFDHKFPNPVISDSRTFNQSCVRVSV